MPREQRIISNGFHAIKFDPADRTDMLLATLPAKPNVRSRDGVSGKPSEINERTSAPRADDHFERYQAGQEVGMLTAVAENWCPENRDEMAR
jgi:hypothetical protein